MPPSRKTAHDWHEWALEDAGLRDMPLHALRHTAATAWLATNHPLIFVQRQLGHRSITTTEEHYGHLEISFVREAAARTEALIAVVSGVTIAFRNENVTLMPYDVYFTAEAETWMLALDDNDYDAIMARIELLEERGPGLGRPVVDSIEGSRHPNMKELRAGSMRALFAFDPLRRAIVLVGGDKRDDWTGWYERNIPRADDLLDAHLASMRKDSR